MILLESKVDCDSQEILTWNFQWWTAFHQTPEMLHHLHLLKKVARHEALPPGHDKAHEFRNHQLNWYNNQQPSEEKRNSIQKGQNIFQARIK